jgi:putative ABC transport system permease protein
MSGITQDLRYALRGLRKSPGFTVVAVLTLALGIGANSAMFSVINAVLLEPLPFREPRQLVRVWRSSTENDRSAMSFPDFADLRAQQSVFEHLAAWRGADYTLTGQGEPVTVRGVVVTANLFSLLGVSPERGRGFTSEEDQAGHRAVVLSHALWQQRFNADPTVIEKTITINSRSYHVVGVMPIGFGFPIQPDPIEMWLSLATASDAETGAPLIAQRGNLSFGVIGRLKPNVAVTSANAALRVVAANLARQHPESADLDVRVVPFHDELVRDVRLGLVLMFGAVGCVLLIACVNVANLLVVRALARRKEMAVRSALGASPRRIVRQLLTESLLLAIGGGLAGCLLAVWGIDVLCSLAPRGLAPLAPAAIDAPVLGFVVLVSLGTGVLFGLAPALQTVSSNLIESLRVGGGTSRRHEYFRNALVVVEVALAVVLLIGSGLLLNSFLRLQRVNPGFDSHNVLTFRIVLPASRYSQQMHVAPFFQELITRLEALPSVKNVSSVSHLPLGPLRGIVGFSIEGVPLPQGNEFPYTADFRSVTPGYFTTMGMTLVAGHDFTAHDGLQTRPVAIVNQSFARRWFADQNPVGKRVRPGYSIDDSGERMREIVGVVSDYKHVNLRDDPPPIIYVPHAQIPRYGMTLVIRTATDPTGLSTSVRNAVQELDEELPISDIKPLDEYVTAAYGEPKFSTLLLASFSCLALVLTIIGLYGVVSYTVTQRTHAIGLRIALGASVRDVLGLVIQHGMRLVFLGTLIGVAGAIAVTRLMKSLLFSVSTTDPVTFGFVILLLAVVALVACYMPAHRASRVDPLVALRYE